MKQFLITLLVLLSFTTNVLADPPPAIPPGPDKIVVVKKGQEAPFDGQLFDNPTALRWGNWLEYYRFRQALDQETYKEMDTAKSAYYKDIISINEKKYNDVTALQKKAIVELEKKAAEPDPWYESFEFGFGMGILAAGLVFSLSILAVTQINKD